jgi:hypothetical protein
MTQRERHATGTATEAGSRPTAGPPALGPAAPSSWEDYFASASPAQRNELLALAARQGVLCAHQLPVPPNGASRDPHLYLLTQLLAGKTDGLASLRVEPVEVEDAALDAVQREAVAKALRTPDVCLIQGLPGTGKTRVLAEVVTRAAAHGERVLLLAATPAALDHALGLLHECETVYAVRCLGRDEKPDTLPPAARSLTFAERVRHLREDTLASVRRALSAADDRRARLGRAEPLWSRLEELADRHVQLTEQLAALQARRDRVALDVEEEARAAGEPAASSPAFRSALQGLRARLREDLARVEKAQAELAARIAEHDKEQAALVAELDRLRPLAEAKQHGRWWTPSWWQATLHSGDLTHLAEKETRLKDLEAAGARLKEESQRLAAEWEQTGQAAEAERAGLVAAEVGRRRAELDDQEAALRQEDHLIQEKWQAACHDLGPEVQPPEAINHNAVRGASEAWRRQLQQADERRSFARQWAAYLEESADTLPARLRDYVNVVAATTTALHADPHFGEAAGGRFDLLVLEEADQVTESEFLNVARRARRWVLVGEPAPDECGTPGAEGQGHARAGGRVQPVGGPRAAPRAPRSAFFHRLWQHLHCDPRRLPCAWVHEKNGLCCRLRPLAPEQRRWLECERVADSPSIELRILAAPQTPPALAEIVFPPSTPIAQAKQYVFRELAELPVRAEHHSLRWHEQPDRLLLALASAPAAAPVSVELEPGVRELVATRAGEANGNATPGGSWYTCGVEFDRAAGWHRQRAEEWAQKHLGVHDPGRTVRLDVPYRLQPDLAAFLSDWLFDGAYDLPHGEPALAEPWTKAAPPAVQFVPVPSLPPERPQPRRGAAVGRSVDGRPGPAPRLARAGAGLELDASDPRHRSRLPLELRSDFAGHGFVNYLEAQAVVRALEKLAGDPALREAARRLAGDPARPVVGVLALYPAQAELIRRLMARAPALAGCDLPIKVDVPAAFREGECLVGLISLTRSHSHRAVSFGEGPQLLVRALTRARARLILFGDPGTLVRRSQWETPLDHLDESASAREHQIVSRLVHYLHGQGAQSHRFQLCEGNGS